MHLEYHEECFEPIYCHPRAGRGTSSGRQPCGSCKCVANRHGGHSCSPHCRRVGACGTGAGVCESGRASAACAFHCLVCKPVVTPSAEADVILWHPTPIVDLPVDLGDLGACLANLPCRGHPSVYTHKMYATGQSTGGVAWSGPW